MAFNRLSLREKLLTKAKPVGDCLVWFGQKTRAGYGCLRLDGRLQRAHRLMYVLHHGPIPDGAVVMHTCDNPACVAIGHLKLGTQADNVKDMHAKKRAVFLRGSENHMSKLTAAQVAEIRRRFVRYSHTSGARPLAREFGISHAAALAIIHRRSWKGK